MDKWRREELAFDMHDMGNMRPLSRFILALVGLGFASSLLAAPPAGGKKSCTDSLVSSEVQPLNFGSFLVNGAGTVTVSPDGIRTATGAVVLVSSAFSAGMFDVTSIDPGNCQTLPLSIRLPNNVTLSDATGTNITANTFVSLPADGTATLDANDYMQLNVGATLTVNAGQTPGTYTATTPYSVDLRF